MVQAVVPYECHAGKAGAIEFFRDFVVLPEGLAKMIQMSIANVLLVRRELAFAGHGMLVLGANIADVFWHRETT